MATRAPVQLPPWAEEILAHAHVDWRPPARQPSARRVVVATVLAVVGSLLADAALVAVGTSVFPSTRGFAHFRLPDYGALTVIGVVIACVGWPIVTRVTSTPRWLFFRLAIVVSAVLLLPDVWILVRGEPADAVAVLMLMHLAIAVVTYNVLVNVAPAGRRRPTAGGGRRGVPATGPAVLGTAQPDHRDVAPRSPQVRLITSSLAGPATTDLRHAGAAPFGSTGASPTRRAVKPARATDELSAPERRDVRNPRAARGRRAGATRPAAADRTSPDRRVVPGRDPGGPSRRDQYPEGPSRRDQVPGGRSPASVARPPASLAEPMSAVRVLPAGHRDEPAEDPAPLAPAPPTGRAVVGRRTAGHGRHVASEPPGEH